MTHPLIDRLTSEFGYPVLNTNHDLTEYTRGEGVHCVFITGDPVRNLETTDVAVVLPELKMTFQGAFDCAVVATEFEDAAKEAAGVFKTPALVFYREGVVLGSIPKVRDWDDYMSRIPQILALHPEGA